MTINLVVCVVVAVLLFICILVLLRLYGRLKNSYEALMQSYQNLEKLNSELRAQRHDYLNHLQVVYGMMELEEYDELHSYLMPVYKDMMKTGKALKTAKPALNALLKAKMGEAESKKIDVYVEVKSDLEGLKIPDWELCKVLSNILDNAITALQEKEEERILRIDITEDTQQYTFSISNNGPMIPKEFQNAIFKQGVSTKTEAGHGMGLYIVANVLKENGGTINLASEEQETIFTVQIKK